jgi:hypothetical protein
MIECIRSPRHKDQETDKDGTNRIDIPNDATSNNGHGKTKGVYDNVVAVVDEKDVNRRVAAVDEAVGTQRTFSED